VNGTQERLGRAVTVLRAERRMQRKALAERSGVPYSFLTSIESGSRGMSQATVAARSAPPLGERGAACVAGQLGIRSAEAPCACGRPS
jgi:predicted transcriptional regulator